MYLTEYLHFSELQEVFSKCYFNRAALVTVTRDPVVVHFRNPEYLSTLIIVDVHLGENVNRKYHP